MGSTAQSTNLTPSTFVAGITQGAAVAWQAVTSSGAYFVCGDLSKTIILVANGSSSDTGAVWIEPGGTWAAGSLGSSYSASCTLYSTATAPVAVSVPLHGITGSSATMSTTGSIYVLNPLDSDRYKSSDGYIFLVASTGSTKMCAAVVQLLGGSTQ